MEHPKKALTLVLISCVCFAVMAAWVRVLESSVSPILLGIFRSLIGMVLIAGSLIFSPPQQLGGRPGLLFVRGFMGTVSLLAFYTNLQVSSLGLATTYVQTAPLFIALFSLFVLREKFEKWSFLGIVLGFVGIWNILHPDSTTSLLGHQLGLISGIGAAIAYTSIRKLKEYYDTRVIVLSFCIIGTVLPLLVIGINWILSNPLGEKWLWKWPAIHSWPVIFGIGISALLGQYTLTQALGYGKVGPISAWGYSQIPMVCLLGFFLGDPFFTGQELFGVILVMIAGVVVSIQQGRKN